MFVTFFDSGDGFVDVVELSEALVSGPAIVSADGVFVELLEVVNALSESSKHITVSVGHTNIVTKFI